MCFDTDSRPPIRPIAGGAADATRLTLRSADGTQLSAFEARAATPSGAAILILPDVRGLHRYYEELALRFAENGVDALSIDYFGRTAGLAPRADDFDYQPHVGQASWESLGDDIRAGVERLRADVGSDASIFATGFCMGGRLAYDSATLGLGLAGVIGFYGWPVGPHRNGSPAPADIATLIECPVLAIFGGADQGIGPDARREFDRALSAAGVDHEVVTFEGAPHSFFDRKATDFQAASDEAWSRTLGFIRERTAARA